LAQVQRNQTKKTASVETTELILFCEVLRKVYSCCPNSADAEWLFSELGRIVPVDKTCLKDSTVMQKALIAADVQLKKRLARKAHGELRVPSRTQKRLIDTGAVLKRLRSIDAGTLSTVDADAEEALEFMDDLSEAVSDANESALADSDLIDVEDHEGTPPELIDDGSVRAASSEEVAGTETALNDFEMLLDHVAEAAGELGWDKFVEHAERDATDEDEEEEVEERVRSFQLYEMEKISRAAPRVI
jgi:hypothetical protein